MFVVDTLTRNMTVLLVYFLLIWFVCVIKQVTSRTERTRHVQNGVSWTITVQQKQEN